MYKLTCSVMHVIAAFLQLLQKTLNCQLSWTDSLCPAWISWRRQIFVSILLDYAYEKLPDPSHQYFSMSLALSIPCLVLLKLHMNVSSVPIGCNPATTHAAKSAWFQQVGIKCNYFQDNPDMIVTGDFKTHSTKNKYLRESFHHLKKDCLQQNERRLQKRVIVIKKEKRHPQKENQRH